MIAMATTLVAFRCGSCRTAQAVPPGHGGMAARCGACLAAIRVPETAIEYIVDTPSESFGQPAPMAAHEDLPNPVSTKLPSKPRKSGDLAFLLLLCLAPALVSSMAVNIYLALQLRSVAAARQQYR
jgi:hypothetical protein